MTLRGSGRMHKISDRIMIRDCVCQSEKGFTTTADLQLNCSVIKRRYVIMYREMRLFVHMSCGSDLVETRFR